MTTEVPAKALKGHHHITIGVGKPQEDFDFHTKVLGLKCVKRTLFYDGAMPIYHFYYGNDLGEESTLLTTFPVAHIGVKATEGVGQVSYVSLSVPESSLSLSLCRSVVTSDSRARWARRKNGNGRLEIHQVCPLYTIGIPCI